MIKMRSLLFSLFQLLIFLLFEQNLHTSEHSVTAAASLIPWLNHSSLFVSIITLVSTILLQLWSQLLIIFPVKLLPYLSKCGKINDSTACYMLYIHVRKRLNHSSLSVPSSLVLIRLFWL